MSLLFLASLWSFALYGATSGAEIPKPVSDRPTYVKAVKVALAGWEKEVERFDKIIAATADGEKKDSLIGAKQRLNDHVRDIYAELQLLEQASTNEWKSRQKTIQEHFRKAREELAKLSRLT